MKLDDLRYQLADTLYRAEGQWGTLQDEIRWHLSDECQCGLVDALEATRDAVVSLLVIEHDEDRRAGCVESIRIIQEMLDILEPTTRDTIPAPEPVEEAA